MYIIHCAICGCVEVFPSAGILALGVQEQVLHGLYWSIVRSHWVRLTSLNPHLHIYVTVMAKCNYTIVIYDDNTTTIAKRCTNQISNKKVIKISTAKFSLE